MVSIKITAIFEHLLCQVRSVFFPYNLIFQESFQVAIYSGVIDLAICDKYTPTLSGGT